MSGEAPGSADVETLKAEIVELKIKNEEVGRSRGLALHSRTPNGNTLPNPSSPAWFYGRVRGK
jgi:hypothetical protein